MTEPKNAIIRQYKRLFELDEVRLEFEDAALDYIVDKAVEYKLGARGLRSICEAVMMDTMFDTFWGGLSYRIGDAVNFLVGVHFMQMLRIGVAYDLTTSKLGFGNGRSFGSLEVFLNGYFQINIPEKKPTVSGNTLYLR